MDKKPVIYIASAYTRGDVAINVRFQMETFDTLIGIGLVTPIAPLWTHFQHLMFPRPYEEWITYDNALLPLYDGCLRLTSEYPRMKYVEMESSGADEEVRYFQSVGKPVFFSIRELHNWARALRDPAKEDGLL